MVVRIAGKRMYLWRAVDHEGEILDMLVQRRRDTQAALRLMRKLLKKQGFAPKLRVKLAVYAATSGGPITGTRFAVRGGSIRRCLGAVK
jgi:transposase-like protein